MLVINFLALVYCLVGGGNSVMADEKTSTKVTFNVIEESEGTTIASTTAAIVKEIARDLKKNGKKAKGSGSPSTPPTSASPTGCVNVPDYENVFGQTCEAFQEDPSLCDDNIPSFDRLVPKDACCACGGSSRSIPWEKPKSCNSRKLHKDQPVEQWTDKKGNSCNLYDYVDPDLCGATAAGMADEGKLSANEVCCRCLVNDSSNSPSEMPSLSTNPSSAPSNVPSVSVNPSTVPSDLPSVSVNPSSAPSNIPSVSVNPSTVPSDLPSVSVNPSVARSPAPSISSSPSVSSSPSTTPLQFSAKYSHYCMVFDQTVKCGGYNNNGQCGKNSSAGNLFSPTKVDLTETESVPIKVATGFDHSCILFADGTVSCMGLLFTNSGWSGNKFSSVQVQTAEGTAPLTGISDIEAGYYHTCAVGVDKMYCWGKGSNGQLFPGSNPDSEYAVMSVEKVVKMALGLYHTCVVLENGKTQCFGDSRYLVGLSESKDIGTVLDITAGQLHTCVLLEDEDTNNTKVQCFGSQDDGRLGNGLTSGGHVQQPGDMLILDTDTGIESALTAIEKVMAGAYSTCVLLRSGKVKCTGDNFWYQLGVAGGNSNRKYPEDVVVDETILDGRTVVSVHITVFNGYVVLDDNTVYSWGYNIDGGLGIGGTDNGLIVKAAGVGDNKAVALLL